MTIASEITRLQWAKADIKTAIQWKWVTVPVSAKLDAYDDYISQIETISDSPLGITWAITYWGLYSVGRNQDIWWLDWCVSYAVGDIVLIWYVGNWQTYDNYDQKDVHFIRRKEWQSRKEWSAGMWTGTLYSFYNEGIYLTKEDNWASYLLTAFARYSTDGTYDWRYRSQIRYTVATDTFTALSTDNTTSINNPRTIPTDNDMGLYAAWSDMSMTTRAVLFTYVGS